MKKGKDERQLIFFFYLVIKRGSSGRAVVGLNPKIVGSNPSAIVRFQLKFSFNSKKIQLFAVSVKKTKDPALSAIQTLLQGHIYCNFDFSSILLFVVFIFENRVMWLFSIVVKECGTAESSSDRSLKSVLEIVIETVDLKLSAFKFIALGKTTRVASGETDQQN